MKFFLNILICFYAVSLNAEALPTLKRIELANASAYSENNELVVHTGQFTRKWISTEQGLKTFFLAGKNIKNFIPNHNFFCDWFSLNSPDNKGELVSLTAIISDDDGFTTQHIKVCAEFFYPFYNVRLRYNIWVYPNAKGIRTCLDIKKEGNVLNCEAFFKNVIPEQISLEVKNTELSAFGYFNHTQGRNTDDKPILQETRFAPDLHSATVIDWSNAISLSKKEMGVLLVKESHKTVNQQGANTGGFVVEGKRLYSYGLGVTEETLRDDKYHTCWANWTILFQGNEIEKQLAIKQFDRLRYPLDDEKDIYILANTWGSDRGTDAANEENILKELKLQSELGIDVQQIDDGWQNAYGINWWDSKRWVPHKDKFPDGWSKVKSTAEEYGIKLGLWAWAMKIDGPDLEWNYDNGGFTYFKLDFGEFYKYEQVEKMMNKARYFIQYTKHKARINWDVTENSPRVGYFFGREYGNLYLENRKIKEPETVVYRPHLVLRDAWQVSKYINLNKIQVSVQNIDLVDSVLSNAYLYNHPYSFAIAMMSSPIFFQETQFYSQKARGEIKEMISVYKKHRNDMYKGYVFPIGEEPNGKSWTGFQNHNAETNSGYLLIFRELENRLSNETIELHFLKDGKVNFENLRTGEKFSKEIKNGKISLDIANTADFLFLKY